MMSVSRWSRFGLTLMAALFLVAAGCEPGGTGTGNDNTGNGNDNTGNGNDNTGGNENDNDNAAPGAPTSDAGEDQSVGAGDTVTLDGSGSSDPDDDALTYAWTQTAGTTVTLEGADTAMATFVAPSAAETLTFELTVSDGTNSSTDSVDVTVTAAAIRLLVVTNNGGILSFLNPQTLDDRVEPTTDLETGATTGIQGQGSDMVVNGAGEMMVAASNRDAVTVHTTVAASGERPFARQVTGDQVQFGDPAGIAVDLDNDVVFISDQTTSIYVYDGASTVDFDGNIPPDREIEISVDGFSAGRMVFYAGDLYVLGRNAPYDIFVIADASTADEGTAPARIISSEDLNSSFATFSIDNTGRLFTASRNDSVNMWNDVTSLDGGIPADATFTIADSTMAAVVADSSDTLYILDSSDGVIHSIDNITDVASGTVDPERTFDTVSGLSLARQLIIHED